MGLIKAKIELVSSNDLALVEEEYIKREDVRQIQIEAFVNTGASMLVINENIKRQLALEVLGRQKAILADGSEKEVEVVGPIEVRFKTRRTTVEALVAPDNSKVLLGTIPIAGMDVVIDTIKQEMRLPPSRPYIARTMLPGIRLKNSK